MACGLLVSLYFLCTFLFDEKVDSHLHPSTDIRLNVLIFWHCLSLFMAELLYLLPDDKLIHWLFYQFFFSSILFGAT